MVSRLLPLNLSKSCRLQFYLFCTYRIGILGEIVLCSAICARLQSYVFFKICPEIIIDCARLTVWCIYRCCNITMWIWFIWMKHSHFKEFLSQLSCNELVFYWSLVRTSAKDIFLFVTVVILWQSYHIQFKHSHLVSISKYLKVYLIIKK